MSLQTALVAIKTANGPLNTLIGTRMHPDKLPQEVVLPAVRFQVIDHIHEDAMLPIIVNSEARVQMDGYAETSAERTTLRTALINAYYGYKGTVGGETLKTILIDSEREGMELLGEETESYRVSIDFMVQL